MNETVKKEQIRTYAEGILQPEIVEDLCLFESFTDEEGDTDIWLLTSDTGNEYWVLEGAYPANIIKKSGIYEDVGRAFAAYIDLIKDEQEAQILPDRFHQGLQ